MSERAETLRRKLREAFAPVMLEVVDESHLHAGHAGAAGGGGHYAVTVVSSQFEGMTAVARHRRVYAVLAAEMGGAIHALSVRARTPAEARDEV